MKNKKDILVGVITIIATTGAMIFSLNYTSNAITENANKTTTPIVINKKDPKFKISNWGMNRTRTAKDAMIERMMNN
jgi:phosphotransferase system IIA component